MAATMDRLDVMARILKNLGHLTELFHREKITPDIISMLSTHEMNQLGITSRVDMMNLRLQCCTYGRQKPEKKRVGCGAPEFDLNQYWKIISKRVSQSRRLHVCFQSMKEQSQNGKILT